MFASQFQIAAADKNLLRILLENCMPRRPEIPKSMPMAMAMQKMPMAPPSCCCSFISAPLFMLHATN